LTRNLDHNRALAGVTLILGGARSGKSLYAERLIEPSGGGIYLATAEALDPEMVARIQLHKDRRGVNWETIEEPLALSDVLGRFETQSDQPILVDCLTLWISNLMGDQADILTEIDTLVSTVKNLRTPIIFVSNEVGLGIVPENRLARIFRDYVGNLNQKIAHIADRVILVTAGIPLRLKG